jgi:CRP/FNR family transcriptional regulator, dissimilatory nitrate respiration regulator
MTASAIRDQINNVFLFQGLSQLQLDALTRIALPRSFRKGQTIFFEGDKAAGFYVVVTGRVKIFRLSPEGKEQIFHLFGKGEPFGEVSVFTGQDYPACAEAYSALTTLFFPRETFIALVKRDESLALNMLALLSMRLRRFAALIEDLSLKEVPGRLAAYLLYLFEKQNKTAEVTLDVSKRQLAYLLGTIPETISRILKRMNQQGLILSKGNRISITDRVALTAISREGKKLSS